MGVHEVRRALDRQQLISKVAPESRSLKLTTGAPALDLPDPPYQSLMRYRALITSRSSLVPHIEPWRHSPVSCG